MTLFKKRKNRSTKRRNQRSLTIESLETRTLMAAGPVFSRRPGSANPEEASSM